MVSDRGKEYLNWLFYNQPADGVPDVDPVIKVAVLVILGFVFIKLWRKYEASK